MKVLINNIVYVPQLKKPKGKNMLAALELEVSVNGEIDGHDGTLTVRQYLRALLDKLWDEDESFNSKRPFGNSSWVYDLYDPLSLAGFIPGLNLNGAYSPTDKQLQLAHAYVKDLIAAVFMGVEG